jgi:hypothetical protein
MHPQPLGATVGEEEASAFVSAGPRQTRLERLDVYHAGYRSRLVECLADDFPAVEYALGEEAFRTLCHAYIAEHPSQSPSLNRFGRHMAPFVLARGGALGAFLHDLAALEWAIVERIHAPPAEAIDLDVLQQVPLDLWAGARFAPSGAIEVLELRYAANRFFQAFREQQGPRIPDAAPTVTVVYRRGWSVWRMDLAPAMRKLLDALFAGVPLGEALEAAAQDGASADDVMTTFREWVAGGFFARIAVGA